MLFRKHIVSTRTLLQLTVALLFLVGGVGAALAANSGIAPLLVPYTVTTVAGTPQYASGQTATPGGFAGEGSYATTSLAHQSGAGVMNSPFHMAVDSVGNIYIADTSNDLIREVNAQTGFITTIAGVLPKGCTGAVCSIHYPGCADGVPAAGSAVMTKVQGIAVDSYGNVYFADSTTQTVSVIYRGGTRVANFISLVNPAGVTASGGTVQPGYVYHIAGTANLTSCSAVTGNADNAPAFENSANPPAIAGAQLHGPGMITLDSAGNIYIADVSNFTTRVINTQATPQTFFQYTVQPGYMRSISNCNAALTTPCPTGTTSGQGVNPQLNTGINGPVNAIVYNSQYVTGQVDAYGNLYQLNGTGSSTGPPGIYSATAYAGGAPLTNLLQAEAPLLSAYYGPTVGNAPAELTGSANLPTYGSSYITIGNPSISSGNLPNTFVDVLAVTNENYDIRSSSLLPDVFGSLWFQDNHYPEISRIDQYTGLATQAIGSAKNRSTTTVTNLSSTYLSPASFTNPWNCVYGASGNPWTLGPITYDPQGDGCPAIVAYFAANGRYGLTPDGLGNIYFDDGGEQLMRELVLGNAFPATTVGAAKPVVQAIQVHFNSSNPPPIGPSVPSGPNQTGNTTTAFSIAPGIPDFTIDTTDPEFTMGALIDTNTGNTAYGFNATTANFAAAFTAGLPSCSQLGVAPNATVVTDYDCLVYVAFNPTAPGVRQSQLVATTANGSVYKFSLSGVGIGGQLAIDGGVPSPVAATGLGKTAGIAVTQSGTLYIADPANNRIVVEPAGGGTQSTLTFTGVTPATLSGPMGVAVDSANNVYISDTGNNRILKVNPVTNAATVLGNYVWISGSTCDTAATAAADCPTVGLAAEPGASVKSTTAPPQYAFNAPQGIAVDAFNNVYVADTGNSAVVEIPSNIALGGATPLLQYPGAPKFVNPVAVAVDSQNNVYVADTKNPAGQIIKLPPGGGDLVTVPGSTFPGLVGVGYVADGVAVDAAGDVYVSDTSSNTVFEIPAGTGPGSTPFALNSYGLGSPAGLALDANGNLYIADSANKQVLLDYRQSPTVNFGNVPQALTSLAQPLCANTTLSDGYNIGATGNGCVLTVTNIGSQPVALTSPISSVLGNGNPAYKVSDNCNSIASGGPLPSGISCTITATFAPTVDNSQSETVNVNGGPQSVALVANGAQPLATVVLTSSGGLSPASGTNDTITATVTQPHLSGVTPTGTVTFTVAVDVANNNVNNCGVGATATVNLNASGVATYTIPYALAQGVQYTVSANYNGDTLNSATQATPITLTVPGVSGLTATVSSTAAQLTFTYGGTPPTITGTFAPPLVTGVTGTFGTAAKSCSLIGSYPVVASFSGTGSCGYGFPPSVFAAGGPAVVTENPAPLTYTLPNFTALYGAANISYGANAVVTGVQCGDGFTTTFTPAQSSILNAGTYSVVPTLSGPKAGNYTITAKPSTLVISPAPTGISATLAKTQVLNTAAGVAAATYPISVSSQVPAGKGVPTGSVTLMDNFVPITTTAPGQGTAVPSCSIYFVGATTSGSAVLTGVTGTFGLATGQAVSGTGIPSGATISAISGQTVTLSGNATATSPAVTVTAASGVANCNAPTVLPLVAGFVTYTPTNTAPGMHQYSLVYSGDSNFQPSELANSLTTTLCVPSTPSNNCLVVDNPDFTLTSTTGPVVIIPGTTPSGNGLVSAPNQSTSAPETAVLFVNSVNGFTGQVALTCAPQNPSYVSCFMTPPTVCVNSSATGCVTSTTAATVIAISTPATLPLGFNVGQLRTSTGRTVLAFLPFGVLAFCVRRRRRLSKLLWMLMVVVGVGAGMIGCGGNQVDFYTPVPTGPQSVTVSATYTGNATQPAAVRTFVVPINID